MCVLTNTKLFRSRYEQTNLYERAIGKAGRWAGWQNTKSGRDGTAEVSWYWTNEGLSFSLHDPWSMWQQDPASLFHRSSLSSFREQRLSPTSSLNPACSVSIPTLALSLPHRMLASYHVHSRTPRGWSCLGSHWTNLSLNNCLTWVHFPEPGIPSGWKSEWAFSSINSSRWALAILVKTPWEVR